MRSTISPVSIVAGSPTQAGSSRARFRRNSPNIAACHCGLADEPDMSGMTGPELQRELTRRGSKIPVIFITAHSDEAVRPSLLELGAVECLFKPFSETELLAAL